MYREHFATSCCGLVLILRNSRQNSFSFFISSCWHSNSGPSGPVSKQTRTSNTSDGRLRNSWAWASWPPANALDSEIPPADTCFLLGGLGPRCPDGPGHGLNVYHASLVQLLHNRFSLRYLPYASSLLPSGVVKFSYSEPASKLYIHKTVLKFATVSHS